MELRVRFVETDQMGVVHHSNYLVYFEAGRVDWLRKRGITYAAWTDRGLQTPVVEAQLSYRASARFDDLLVLATTITKVRSVSLDYGYRITRGVAVLAEGSTRLATIDANGKLYRMPEDVRAALLSGELPR